MAQAEAEEAEADDLGVPPWLVDLPGVKEEPVPVQIEAQETEEDTGAPPSPEISEEEAVDTGEELEIPSWLINTPFEEIEAPPWLAETETQKPEMGVSTAFSEKLETGQPPETEPVLDEQYLELEGEPEAPSWLKDTGDLPPFDPGATPETRATDMPAKGEPSTWLAGVSTTIEALKPGKKETIDEEGGSEVAESTGMIAGLTAFLPAEKISTARADLAEQDDDLLNAAREFYAIATQPPQPAVLPAPLTRRDKLIGGAVRSALYLLFMVLVALPLLSSAQKVVDGTPVPWTEPTGQWHEVLDNQRRQMISEELGVVDVQQPNSVALVSFDYSLATAGEMQPLAEAVIGRLLGQGMRVVTISLEPEGATIAQETLESILAKREEAYGQNSVNLGYLPGQVAAVRGLAITAEPLSAIPDYRDNIVFDHPDRAAWADIRGLDQVDLIVSLADNPATVRWWVEQLESIPQPAERERFLLAATSATAGPFLQPYRASQQLDGLISGINGAAAIEAVRNNFGLARQMLDSQSVAHLIIVILIAIGTMVGWMPTEPADASTNK
jgi:hypothetical protein